MTTRRSLLLRPLRIGTRASPLAVAQATEVVARLAASHALPLESFEIVPMSTRGDRTSENADPEVGIKGLFTLELEERLVSGDLDVAVHSCKDVAATLPEGLHLSAYLPREDSRDAFISRSGRPLWELGPGAVVGTSSVRRRALLLMHRPDLVVVPFRGLVGTRLRKLNEGLADATLLAQAGLNRLGLGHLATEILNPRDFPPAPAQGAICIESRKGDTFVSHLVSVINDPSTEHSVRCERSFLRVLDGSCRTPISAHASCHGSEMVLRGLLVEPDGSGPRRVVLKGSRAVPEELGEAAAAMILAGRGTDARGATSTVLVDLPN